MCACIYFMLVSTHVQVGMWRTEINVGPLFYCCLFLRQSLTQQGWSQAIYVAKVGLEIQILLLPNTDVIGRMLITFKYEAGSLTASKADQVS